MDTNTSGEKLITKTRKPYTIRKQRERWTEDEHNRFLEALRLYGRAWQRIEEHIGTKTAVQIRSHAQKFFTKLEKEARGKGIPVCQALDIEIPPPRPKRKPSTPYPRKLGNAITTLHASSLSKDANHLPLTSSSQCKRALGLEKEPLPEKSKGLEETSKGKENQDENCTGTVTHLPEARCSSISSVNRDSSPNKVALNNPCTFREFVPSLRKATADNGTSQASNVENSCDSRDNAVQDLPQTNLDRNNGLGVNGLSPTDDTHNNQNYPWHVPVPVLNGSMGAFLRNPPDMPFQDFVFRPVGKVHGHSGLLTKPGISNTKQNQDNEPTRPSHPVFPAFHPAFTPACHTQDDYLSFLQISSTFSNLIVSTLLQNPAAHAVASFAASFWPYASVGISNDSSSSTIHTDGAFPPRQMSSPPTMTAIAAATVAAATAWWAANGLLPICAPFTCLPMSTAVAPPPDSGQITVPAPERNMKETSPFENPQKPKGEQSEAQQAQNLALRSPGLSSDDSEEIGRTKIDVEPKRDDHKEESVAVREEVNDSNTTKNNKKLVDRSSCGSNTPSDSDIETDALEKDKDKEDVKETDANQPVTDSSNRRSRSRDNNSSDSWKEVSEEGRLAFQALFSRQRLPQSFSPPPDTESNKNHKENLKEKEKNKPDENPYCNTQDCSSNDKEENANKTSLTTLVNNQEKLSTIGLGAGKNLRTSRTGFKPYKRCSVEAKETRVMNSNGQAEEKGSKRIRLEGGASS